MSDTARPAETVSESVPARHETPDVTELRDQIAGTIHRRICEHSREDCIENLGKCERATDSAMPLISTALDEGHAMARLLADALKDAIRTLRELAEKAAGEPIPFDDSDLYAEVVDGALDAAAERDALAVDADKWQRAALTLQRDRDALTDERDSLSWQVEALRAERDARSSERDALAAKVERVRALPAKHPAGGWYMTSMRDVLAALDEEPQQ